MAKIEKETCIRFEDRTKNQHQELVSLILLRSISMKIIHRVLCNTFLGSLGVAHWGHCPEKIEMQFLIKNRLFFVHYEKQGPIYGE